MVGKIYWSHLNWLLTLIKIRSVIFDCKITQATQHPHQSQCARNLGGGVADPVLERICCVSCARGGGRKRVSGARGSGEGGR